MCLSFIIKRVIYVGKNIYYKYINMVMISN